MNDITFTSSIRLVKTDLFNKTVSAIPKNHFVAAPWTCKESVKAAEAYTNRIMDCTLCGITDGKDVFMMHICPTENENKHFAKIKEYLKERIDLNNPDLQGFLLGARDYPDDKSSVALFDKFVELFKSLKIPFSRFKGSDNSNSLNVAYFSSKDEWLISSYPIDKFVGKKPSEELLKSVFQNVKLSNEDYFA